MYCNQWQLIAIHCRPLHPEQIPTLGLVSLAVMFRISSDLPCDLQPLRHISLRINLGYIRGTVP